MNKPHDPASATNAALLRAQAFMTPSPVPSISTELLVSADGELNRELHHFLFDPPSNPELLKGKKIAICCSNGVEEIEIVGATKWLTEHGATVHVVAPRIGEFHPTLGLRFPPLTKTHWPWQMAVVGLPEASMSCTNFWASLSARRKSGFQQPPGNRQAS